MPQFITRIELHGARGEDYFRLHSVMESRGFSRKILGGDGMYYLLPTAEYIRSGSSLTPEKVRGDAQGAASTVSANFAVLVAEATGKIMWLGLGRA
jgi:hypothetical protein